MLDVEAELRRARAAPLWEAGATTRALHAAGEALHRLLPHRPPFLLLDAIEAVDPVLGAIAARRAIHADDPVFAGHFPGDPVYPGVLLVETMAQCLACLGPLERGGGAVRTFATGCRATFLRPVRPGDALTVLARRIGAQDGLRERGLGQVLRGNVVCAIALVEGAVVGGAVVGGADGDAHADARGGAQGGDHA